MNTYPHMCRDEHEEIGHRDGEHEMCPLCRANARIAELERDAARYRWLRENPAFETEAFLAGCSPESYDTLVDEQRSL